MTVSLGKARRHAGGNGKEARNLAGGLAPEVVRTHSPSLHPGRGMLKPQRGKELSD